MNKTKARIVYIVPYLINSGPINVLYNIIKYLDLKKNNPVIISLIQNKYPEKSNKNIFEKLNVELVEYPYTNLYLQFHIKSIAKDIEKRFNNPNTVFHAHGYYPTLILSHIKDCHSITTIHNICGQDFRMSKGLIMGTYMTYMYKKSLKHLSLSVPISDYMQSYYAKDSTLKFRTIYNGVEQCKQYNEKEKQKLKDSLKINSKTKVFLYPANISYLKNQLFIIEAIKKSYVADVLILFAGHGEAEDECIRLAGDDSRFRFLGFQMDLSPYWAITDFMISSSKSEGLPMAVLEALVQGIPCILSNISPHQEIIRHVFNFTDLCFDLNSFDSFISTLEYAINTPFDKNKISHQASIYTSKVMSEKYSSLYLELLNQK